MGSSCESRAGYEKENVEGRGAMRGKRASGRCTDWFTAPRPRLVSLCSTEDGPVRSSMLSHRLLEEAYARGGSQLQLPFALALFRSYHEQGQDNGLASLLIQLAVENQLFPDVEAAQAWWDSTERVAEVEKRIFQARNKKGIQGVPYTELKYDGRLVVVRGALEPTEILAKLMGSETAQQQQHAGGAKEGVACL